MARLKIDKIKVRDRYRKHLGDVDALAASIEELGLLHPIVTRPDGRLIAGERRLAACRRLGWKTVPVTIVDCPLVGFKPPSSDGDWLEP
jgi:ParB-like chromosome segregation protein Spo0J